jgi:murein DD-endopeptidase MepM/ murein hydrolase activator NlpD
MRSRSALVPLLLVAVAFAGAPPQDVQAGGRYPRFLTLPFPGTWKMRIQDGWLRNTSSPLHRGFDYIRGKIDNGGTWRRFPVIAAASGKACAALNNRDGCIDGIGTRVVIRHRRNGHTFYTYYGHLDTVSRRIPIGTNSFDVRVRRGQFLGWAGRTGLPGTGLHLHFQVMRTRSAATSLDPYDVYGYRGAYPNPAGTNGRGCGPNRLFINCPPEPPDETSGIPRRIAVDVPRPAALIRRTRRGLRPALI